MAYTVLARRYRSACRMHSRSPSTRGRSTRSCQAGPDGAVNTQACMFSDLGQSAAAAARGAESQLPTKHEQMKDEIVRLANQDDRFAQAILDWYEKTQQYEAARRRRTED